MVRIREISVPNYEKVIEGSDENGFLAYIAVHNTQLGPAMGGTRIYPYPNSDAALKDALNLAQAMTYKSALAENKLGGGKAVIMMDPKSKNREANLLAFGELVDSLNGKFIAAEDVGTSPQDMEIVRRRTPYVGALQTDTSSGDPSRYTAWGVYRGILAVAEKLWHRHDLSKKIIAIQGLGHVGSKLAEILFWQGAYLIVSDRDPAVAHQYAHLYGADVVEPEDFLGVRCDILAPCAMGGIINANSIPKLHCKAIAGAANNQLQTSENGWELMHYNILYAPDFAINAGGIINAASEYDEGGYNPKVARDRVNHIFDTLKRIFSISEKEHKPTNVVAEELAEKKLRRKANRD